MSTTALDALHDVHTATNDVLKGYRELSARAEPDIQPVIGRLLAMHERHAEEQSAELSRHRDASRDDTSLQGTVNKTVVILRDWVSHLDRDVLPAVRDGEASLLGEFDKALHHERVVADAAVAALLERQRVSINAEIARLPKQA